MWLPLSLFSMFSLFPFISLKSVKETSTPGICLFSRVVERRMFTMDRINKVWKVKVYNHTEWQNDCCEGYRQLHGEPLTCEPICDPPCENSDCMAPNTCVCHLGHVLINNSSNTCYEVCDSCVHGQCLHPEDTECTCDLGYERDYTTPHICDPICSPECVNGNCHYPYQCECYEGYQTHPNIQLKHVCVPHCEEECVFGICTEPNTCTCLEGHINDEISPSICLPVCNHTCVNGDCFAPDMCKCRPGYKLHEDNPYMCIADAPEDSSFNYCELTMPQAVMFDENLECFSIKEEVNLTVPSNCSVLYSQPGSFCSQPGFCHQSECVLNFRCKKHLGINEIHCFFGDGDFETGTVDINHITNATDWTDMVLVVNSRHVFNLSGEVKVDTITKWTLKPLSTGPYCGEMYFAVELSECEHRLERGQEKKNINSSFKFWMNVGLVCGFFLMIGTGVGGFLWARHRRLNDPLNYRNNMSQGFDNHCYDNRAAELVPEDDSDFDNDNYSEAPL